MTRSENELLIVKKPHPHFLRLFKTNIEYLVKKMTLFSVFIKQTSSKIFQVSSTTNFFFYKLRFTDRISLEFIRE
jgi:hypothetical protein